MPFERERDNRTQQQPERHTIQPLVLTPDQIRKLSEMTRKDGFLAFDDDEIEMILELSNPCLLPDFRRFIYRASGLGLNPLNNEIHMEYKFSKNQPKATFVLHIDGLRKIADRSGMRGGFAQKPGIDERGEYVESTVWRKDCQQPFVSRVYCQEFMQTGEYSLYRTKPYHMVAKCFDEETEVLTDRGFQLFSCAEGIIMQVTRNGLEPTDAAPFSQDWDGEMIAYESDDLNFCVTVNHDMVTTIGKVPAAELYEKARSRPKFRIPRCIETTTPDLPISDSVITLAAFFLADGSVTTEQSISYTISVSRPRKVAFLDALNAHQSRHIRDTAGDIAHTTERDVTTLSDKVEFRYPLDAIAPICLGKDLINFDTIAELSRRQARLFVDTWIFCDGHVDDASDVRRLYANRTSHAKAFELACVVAGYSISPWRSRLSDISTEPNLNATISSRDSIPVKRTGRAYNNLERPARARKQPSLEIVQNTSGKVWCVTVPSGVIVVRRHGFSMLCGNCGEAFAYKQAFPVSGLNTEDEVEAWPGDQGPRVAQENTGLTVAEKTPEPALAPNPAPAPAPNPAPNPAPEPADAQRKPPASAAAAFGPRVTEPPKPLYQVIADRLKALGVEKSEVTDWTNFYFRYPDRKLTQDDYVEAFGKAEEWIKANSIEQFRAGLKESREQRAEWIRQNGQPGSPAAPAAPAAPATDPDLDRIAAQLSAQVSARFKTWGPELVKLGSLWCVDHVKDAGALEAFLITAGLTDQTPPGRIEALLAISRHMGMSSGIAILEYSAKTNDPLSMIESQISQAVGKTIRFATDIPKDAVAKAFADLQAKAANQAAGAVK